MEIIVPADSPIKDLKDLKGKTVAFVSMSSNSGAKAPIVLLKEKHDLQVDRDYRFAITGSHQRSILGVCVGQSAASILSAPLASEDARKTALAKPGGRFEAAFVASDMLARMVAEGTVKAEQYRVIGKEGPFPVLCFGVPHNLDPALVVKIKDAFASFPFEGNRVGEKYRSSGKVKFAPVDYRKDWQKVREIDEKLPSVIQGN
jgi:phosphonate transport system substrate-binding protein